ncbi:unnamed protein product [Chironomus riparius]|uniref:Fatty acid desaturase domain-containing protein n=1 Tax=Chironomus riparius TaxID=315576 RepID=A0A9N9RK60_9DIPT|nr:unnamed protein product [Chironomus riparius]
MHAMSHHLYPNSYHDLECVLFEPFFNWIPMDKNFLQKYVSWIISPVIYGFIFPKTGFFRYIGSIVNNYKLHWDDLIPFTMPLLMYTFGSVGIIETVIRWLTIIFVSSVIHGTISVNGGHHHNKVFHDGDELKSLDFGVYQLAATFDRFEFQKNSFAVLTTFGQHIGHHMFPTLDHALLPQLNDIIYDTCKEFEADLVMYPWYKLFIGQFIQLTRTDINKI